MARKKNNIKFSRLWHCVTYVSWECLDIFIKCSPSLKWSCSILHDCDTEEEKILNSNGENFLLVGSQFCKKPHFHTILYFQNGKSESQVEQLWKRSFQQFCVENGEREHENIKAVMSNDIGYSVRYLCHLDNPNKHQYNFEDVRHFHSLEVFKTYCFTDKQTKQYRFLQCLRLINTGTLSYDEILMSDLYSDVVISYSQSLRAEDSRYKLSQTQANLEKSSIEDLQRQLDIAVHTMQYCKCYEYFKKQLNKERKG